MLVMLMRSYKRRRNLPSKVSLGEETIQRQGRVQPDARGKMNTLIAEAEGLNADKHDVCLSPLAVISRR